MVGLSRISDATSSTYTTIDYAIFIVTKDRVQIYENAANRGDFSFTGSLDDVYKVEKTGTVIKYYRNTTLIHTSTVATTEALYLDTAFKTTGSIVTNIRMLNTPLVITPETTDYKLYLNNNPNVIGYHIDELVSDTDFADIDAALADDAVKKAIAGDFVMIASKIYHVIKTNDIGSSVIVNSGGNPVMSLHGTLSATPPPVGASGLSYKNSEADATSITFQLIDYAWYFRASDQKAFVREALYLLLFLL
jgi:hypothetical protein